MAARPVRRYSAGCPARDTAHSNAATKPHSASALSLSVVGMLLGVPSNALRSSLLASLLLLAGNLAGCHGGDAPGSIGSPTTADQQRQLNNQVRGELEAIPPPTKARFANVHSLDAWSNPYLTVQDNMLTLHVTIADANTSNFGQNGMLRPTGARRQILNIRAAELPAALNAVPLTAWPYGRVIAVEEAHNTPKAMEPQVRRSMEGVMRTLTDLGVVVYEWTDTGAEIR